MADLIDRAALLKAIRKEAVNAMELNANRYCESALTFGHCYSMVKKAPAVDAVEVVKCEACKSFGLYSHKEYGFCTHPYGLINPKADDFCSHGERKENG